MSKKSFTFSPPARHRDATATAAPDIDREILKKTLDDGVRALENARIIPLTRLHPDPDQPRRHFDAASLAELAASIKSEGILQPLWVRYRYEEDDFMIISGERRYRAAIEAGLTEVPVLIGNVGATQRFLHQLIENLQREDLNPIDKGEALERLKTMLPGNWQEMADVVGLTRRRVEQLRALPRLPRVLQDAIRTRLLTEDHARAIAGLPEPFYGPLLDAVEHQKLSTRRTRDLVRVLRADMQAVRHEETQAEVDPSAAALSLARVDAAVTAFLNGSDLPSTAPSRRDPARPRSRAAIPVYEKALEFERVLDRMPVLEFQEDRLLLTAILTRIAAKIAAINVETR